MLVGHDQLDLVLRAHRHLQAAQVNPVPRRERLPGVPGAALGPRRLRGHFVLGRLVVGLIVELVIGQFLTVIEFAGPIPANVC